MDGRVLALALIAFLAVLATIGDDMITDVKNGTKVLTCEFKDGPRVVAPEMVESYSGGRWMFKNGSAINCTTKEG